MNGLKFSRGSILALSDEAQQSSRLRKHSNVHQSYDEPCQYILNAIGVGSYIRPHRHSFDPKFECLVAIKGHFALFKFFDDGKIKSIDQFGTEIYQANEDVSVAVLISPETWHTVVALVPGSVLLEIKPGPFSINTAKEFAQWAPKEGSNEAMKYLLDLKSSLFFILD